MSAAERIAALTLPESPPQLMPEIAHERGVALADLLRENQFSLTEHPCGPYNVVLREEENRLVFDVSGAGMAEPQRIVLSLQRLKRIIRDYFLICESYYAAIKDASPHRLEAIDMGRRGMHNEGAAELQEMLEGRIALDFCTARRLFTLICALCMK